MSKGVSQNRSRSHKWLASLRHSMKSEPTGGLALRSLWSLDMFPPTPKKINTTLPIRMEGNIGFDFVRVPFFLR